MLENIKGGIKQRFETTRTESKKKGNSLRPGAPPKLEKGIISGLKEGSHSSFETVFHTFYYRVRNFILSLTKDNNLSEELTQQVFVNIWENRAALDPEKSFNSYVYVLARNATMAYFRTANVHRRIEKEIFSEEPSAEIESGVFAREAQLLIELTVGNMPRQRKKIYELSQLHNKSNHEIAVELNITKKAVEKHLRLAFSDIRSVLQRFISLLFF